MTVVWENPDDYRDVKAASGRQDRYENHVFATLGKQFQKSLGPLLNDDEKLVITVSNLDLAGDVRPSFGATTNDIRIVKSVYPPRISFRWSLLDGSGNEVEGDRVELKDLGFERGPATARFNNEPLKYELAMIERWVRDEVPPVLAARR
ncbi:DUF3016 domain-containing protein [Ferrimonas sediminicola]|uniref:DUF3016 domain-containing protein n=1 Tax=Ferrimonas sediminicola TaxID=2569538 RepID=UPI00145DA8B5|nr:DUF3016 domain-containing protein [Ferrimonas sediminicola]